MLTNAVLGRPRDVSMIRSLRYATRLTRSELHRISKGRGSNGLVGVGLVSALVTPPGCLSITTTSGCRGKPTTSCRQCLILFRYFVGAPWSFLEYVTIRQSEGQVAAACPPDSNESIKRRHQTYQ